MQRRARENGAWIRVAFIKKYAGTVLGAALLLALAVFGITYRNEIWAVLTQQDARDAFIAFVHDSGFLGLLAFLGLQVLQVVVAVLPGEPVELMAGLLYGTWGGLTLCLWAWAFPAPQFITACVPRVPEPSTLPFWQNTIFCGTRHT